MTSERRWAFRLPYQLGGFYAVVKYLVATSCWRREVCTCVQELMFDFLFILSPCDDTKSFWEQLAWLWYLVFTQPLSSIFKYGEQRSVWMPSQSEEALCSLCVPWSGSMHTAASDAHYKGTQYKGICYPEGKFFLPQLEESLDIGLLWSESERTGQTFAVHSVYLVCSSRESHNIVLF